LPEPENIYGSRLGRRTSAVDASDEPTDVEELA
jgi:hypothetical protein